MHIGVGFKMTQVHPSNKRKPNACLSHESQSHLTLTRPRKIFVFSWHSKAIPGRSPHKLDSCCDATALVRRFQLHPHACALARTLGTHCTPCAPATHCTSSTRSHISIGYRIAHRSAHCRSDARVFAVLTMGRYSFAYGSMTPCCARIRKAERSSVER
jgi:hypothetical protein